MRDNLDLQELRERIESYQRQQRAIRNRSLITALGVVIILVWLWMQPIIFEGFFNGEMFGMVKNLSFAFSPLILLFVIIYLWYQPNQKLLQDRSQRAAKYMAYLFHDVSDLPVDEADTQTQDSFTKAYNLALIVLFGWLLLEIFSGSDGSVSGLLLFFIAVLMAFAPVIKPMIVMKLSVTARRYLVGEIRDRIILLGLLVAAGFGMVLGLSEIATSLQFENYERQLLYVSAFVVLYFIALTIFYNIRQRTQFFNPLRDGNYDMLDERLNAIAEYSQDLGTFYWLGLIAQFHGESEIAESRWRKLIEVFPASNVQILGVALNNLASNRLSLGDYEEALKYFEASIRLTPELPGIYRGLLNFYNRLDLEPERVIELSQLMTSLARKPRLNLMFNYSEWSQTLAASAVAHARIGDFTAANILIDQAFNECDKRFKSNVASLHNSNARIALLANDPEQARYHYRQAVSVDPDSAEGKYAQEYLTAT